MNRFSSWVVLILTFALLQGCVTSISTALTQKVEKPVLVSNVMTVKGGKSGPVGKPIASFDAQAEDFFYYVAINEETRTEREEKYRHIDNALKIDAVLLKKAPDATLIKVDSLYYGAYRAGFYAILMWQQTNAWAGIEGSVYKNPTAR